LRKLFQLPLRTRARAQADADAELESFLEARIEDLVRRGMTREDARAESLARLGGPLGDVRATLRDSAMQRERRLSLLDTLDAVLLDARHTLRGLARRPGFAVTAVLCLATGIAANATMFGVVDALLLRPPPGVKDPGSLVWATATERAPAFLGGFTEYHGVMYADYADAARSSTVAGIAAYAASQESFGRGTDLRQVSALSITSTFMPLLGARPALGRFFTGADDSARASPAVILGYAFWQTQFGGDTDVIGRAVRVDTVLFTVVGVAPRDFNGITRSQVDIYVSPLAGDPDAAKELTARHGGFLTLVARLRPDARPERLASELDALYHNATPGDRLRAHNSIMVRPLNSISAMASGREVQDGTISLWLASVALVVLLITCANVASLLLTRAVRRSREAAVRLALGIGRGRLLRMLAIDGLVLAAFGGLASLAFVQFGGAIVRRQLLAGIAVGASALEPRMLAFTAVATILTGLLCGLAPAFYATRRNLTIALKSGEREGTRSGSRLLGGLLVGQVALTLLLLVGTGLFVRSVWNLDRIDFGFDVHPVLRARAPVWAMGYTKTQTDRFFHELLDRVRVLPGIQRAALATAGPFGNAQMEPLVIPGHPDPADTSLNPEVRADLPVFSAVTPEFFATVGMSLRKGRLLTEVDRAGSERVAIVNEQMVRRYWAGSDAIGKCIKIGGDTMPCTTVVGVVSTARSGAGFRVLIQNERPQAAYYVPYDQQDLSLRAGPFGSMLYVRTVGEAVHYVPLVRRTMETLAPEMPYPDVQDFSTALAPQIRPWQLGVEMFSLFGVIALGLAVLGLYGVLALRVSQRTHEIGIRVAVGAKPSDIHLLVLEEGFRLAGLGVGVGVIVALVLGGVAGRYLFQTSPRDPVILVGTASTLIAVAAIACVLSARRAARIDPLEALREL
jgi:predicted permease